MKTIMFNLVGLFLLISSPGNIALAEDSPTVNVVQFELKAGLLGMYVGPTAPGFKKLESIMIVAVNGDQLSVKNQFGGELTISSSEIALSTRSVQGYFWWHRREDIPQEYSNWKSTRYEVHRPGMDLTLRQEDSIILKTEKGFTWNTVAAVGETFAVLSDGQIINLDTDSLYYADIDKRIDPLRRIVCLNIANEKLCTYDTPLLIKNPKGDQELNFIEGINPSHPEVGVIVSTPPYMGNIGSAGPTKIISFSDAIKGRKAMKGRETGTLESSKVVTMKECRQLGFTEKDCGPAVAKHLFEEGSEVCQKKGLSLNKNRPIETLKPYGGLFGGSLVPILFECQESQAQ